MNRNRIVSLVAALAAALGVLVAAPAALADSPWQNPTGPNSASTGAPAADSPADSPWGPK